MKPWFIGFFLLGAVWSGISASAQTMLILDVRDSMGSPVSSGEVILERDGEAPMLINFDNGRLEKSIEGQKRFSLNILADGDGFRPGFLGSLSTMTPSKKQEITIELRRMDEPAMLKEEFEKMLLQHLNTVRSKAVRRPPRGR